MPEPHDLKANHVAETRSHAAAPLRKASRRTGRPCSNGTAYASANGNRACGGPRTRLSRVLADRAHGSRGRSGYCGGMGLLGDLIKTVSDVVTSGRRRGGAPSREAGRRGRRRPTSTSAAFRADAEVLPGEFGPDATVEVDPRRIGPVRMSYSPQTDGAPDPGEVVWTWVPFQESDGRGKDRPVLVVAVESAGTCLAVQLTSKDHDGEGDFVSVGAGGWDGEHRPSWVNLDRVIRVHEGGMRREAAACRASRSSGSRAGCISATAGASPGALLPCGPGHGPRVRQPRHELRPGLR